MIYDVIIVGSGPAGMTAGIYTSRALLKTVIIEKAVAGGLMTLTDKLDNWPGNPSISGGDLAENMLKQAVDFGCEFRMGDVTKVDKLSDGNFSVELLDEKAPLI
ncbi:MAG TPA: FAD-dependent oxidoreductase, partial [bacterium]|nr:FAD-dependent oxidoreductase [bacterium]